MGLSGPTPVTQTIPLNSNSNCTNAGQGAICQAALPLAPGVYAAAVSESGLGNAFAGVQTIAFAVSYGSGTVVNVTLSGVPAQVNIVPGAPMSATNAQSGVDLYGAGRHQLVAQLVDANQNVIIGATPPVVTVTQTGGVAPMMTF